jgi:hypothetical protein
MSARLEGCWLSAARALLLIEGGTITGDGNDGYGNAKTEELGQQVAGDARKEHDPKDGPGRYRNAVCFRKSLKLS